MKQHLIERRRRRFLGAKSTGTIWKSGAKNTVGFKPGINTHIGQYPTEYGGSAAGVVDAANTLGFRFLRDNMSWGGVESSAGVYSFAGSNQVNLATGVQRAHDQGYDIDWHLMCGYQNVALYGSTADATWRGHYVDFIEAVCNWWVNTKGWSPSRLVIEVWNEPENFGTEFDDDAEMHLLALLIEQVYPAVKAISTSIRVSGPCSGDPFWSGNAARWSDWFTNAPSNWADNVDLWSANVYDGGSADRRPESVAAKWLSWVTGTLNAQFDANGGRPPLYVGETGWSSAVYSETVRAEYMARWLLLLSAYAHRAALYEFIDSGGEQYGLRTNFSTPKASETFVGEVCEFLKPTTTAAHFYASPSMSGGMHAIVFDAATGQRVALWNDGAASLKLRVAAIQDGSLVVQSVGGSSNEISVKAGDNSVHVLIGRTPTLIYSDDAILSVSL